MKRILLIFALIICSVFFISCKDAINLEMYLSEIRNVVYIYNGEDYTLTVYGEQKETPYLSDGYVSEMKTFVTVKIENYKTALDDASVTVNFGEQTLTSNFEYDPLSGKFTAQMETQKLPSENEIEVKVCCNGNENLFTVQKISNEGQIDYKTALNNVSYEKNAEIKKMLSGSGDSIEVRIRLLSEGDSVYYYVAIIAKEGKSFTYLIDGASGKILAERST
ncbi:MAG: hypothetical protein E7358_06660 [Clostridiales bacterium]|nr:hypothetical protein [Clostridiales bacterium]